MAQPAQPFVIPLAASYAASLRRQLQQFTIATGMAFQLLQPGEELLPGIHIAA